MTSSKASKSRARGWCFTLNNPEISKEEYLATLSEEKPQYAIVGEEVGESGTRHFQGFIYFKSARSFDSMKKLMAKAHIESMVSNQLKASEYCKKDGLFIEYGDSPKQGSRTDMCAIADSASAGVPIKELLEEGTIVNLQQLQFYERVQRIYKAEKKRNWQPTVIWVHGPTGSGKSRYAHEAFPDAWTSSGSLKYWEGYVDQEVVIIDDFRKDFCTYHELLNILDRYEYRVNVKFGSAQLVAKTIIITAPQHFAEMYAEHAKSKDNLQQLVRRIREVFWLPFHEELYRKFLTQKNDTEVGLGNTIPTPPQFCPNKGCGPKIV